MYLLNATEDSNSTAMNLLSVRDRLHLEGEERATGRLQHGRQREQEGRRSEWTEVSLIDVVYTVRSLSHTVSVAFGGFIGVELNSEGSVVSTCT